MTNPGLALQSEPHQTFWRSLQTLNVTRIVIACVLLVYLGLNDIGFRVAGPLIYGQGIAAYLLLAIVFFFLTARNRHRFLLQLSFQIVIDLFVIAMLYAAGGGAKSGLAILFLFPLAGVAILAPLILALFFCSVVTLFLLGENWYHLLALDGEASSTQVGLYGAAFFSAVFVVSHLAGKLIRQEELATQRGVDLQIQQSINRLVIADMGDGIVVLGRDSTVFTCNPSAEYMLGISLPYDKLRYKLTQIVALSPIADSFFHWLEEMDCASVPDASGSTYVSVKLGEEIFLPDVKSVLGTRRDLAAHLKLRFATVETVSLVQDRYVIFMQDVTDIDNQAQQLKLASMGRLTASIAHEVRNPLSAISHAAALLREELLSSTQARLLNIVGDNVTRVNRIIEDILQLSRKTPSHGELLAIFPFLEDILGELQETLELPDGMLVLRNSNRSNVRFDPQHLREVVVNLLTNAVRYSSGLSECIQITLVSEAVNRLELHVRDDGPGITPEVRAHLFEPFYTTSSKGTGLGLYLARELCLNNGAMLDYEYRLDTAEDGIGEASGRFVITFAVADDL